MTAFIWAVVPGVDLTGSGILSPLAERQRIQQIKATAAEYCQELVAHSVEHTVEVESYIDSPEALFLREEEAMRVAQIRAQVAEAEAAAIAEEARRADELHAKEEAEAAAAEAEAKQEEAIAEAARLKFRAEFDKVEVEREAARARSFQKQKAMEAQVR